MSREGGQTPSTPGQGTDGGEQAQELSEQTRDTISASSQPAEDASSQVGGQPQRRFGQYRDRASQFGHRARGQADAGKEKAATGMHRAAERMRERGGGSEGFAGQASTKAADGMDKAADYLKERNPDEMLKDAERYAKEHPGQAIAGAVVAGFLLGKILL
jgi:ElaB/YqjD/DUF883 family membrane-anchored ribosome-binding protein